MTPARAAALTMIAKTRDNGCSIELLHDHGVRLATLRDLESANLIERFQKTFSRPAGLVVTCYRATAAGRIAAGR